MRLSGQDSDARHVQPSPCGAARLSRRPPLHAAAASVERQAPVEICNSPLSEAGVLGFEYGYSLDCPDGLVMWEAQFGDFVNVAQVIIDQFIASAEDKWRRLSGLDAAVAARLRRRGPRALIARLERFLMLAAEDNLQVVIPRRRLNTSICLRRQVVAQLAEAAGRDDAQKPAATSAACLRRSKICRTATFNA